MSVFLALVVPCFWSPTPNGCASSTLRVCSLLCRGSSLCSVSSLCPVGGVMVRPGGGRWPMLRDGWSGSTGEGLWGCRGGEALSHVPRCVSHLPGGMAASVALSLGSEEVQARCSSKVLRGLLPSRLLARTAHRTQRQSSCRAGMDHQGRMCVDSLGSRKRGAGGAICVEWGQF